MAQVLSDVLLREVGHQNPSGRKLVVFSDSRQDAAKLSAGMRFAHYRDSVRQALASALDHQGAGVLAFIAQQNGQTLTPRQQLLANAFAATHTSEVATLLMAAQPATANQPSPTFPQLTCQQAAQRIQTRAAHGPYLIAGLAIEVASQLLQQGIILAGMRKTCSGQMSPTTPGIGEISTTGRTLGRQVRDQQANYPQISKHTCRESEKALWKS
jgi:hypothetical protein